jgi:uncharacterized protein
MTPMVGAIALGVGAGMGVLGGGGSIIVVPLLTFVFGFTTKDAVTASLAIVAMVAGSGAVSSILRRVLPMRVALTVGISATIFGLIGGAIGARLPDATQLGLLAMAMFGAAMMMWRFPVRTRVEEQGVPSGRLIAIGAGAGLLTGVLGVGGGFLIVPALVLGAHLPIWRAAPVSLFVMTLAAIAAMSRYAGDTLLPWSFIGGFALIASLGSVGGGIIAHRLPQRILQQAFAVLLVILGSYVLLRA